MFIDSHFHLPHKKYEKSNDEIVAEASQAGVGMMVAIGTSISESELTLSTISKYNNVYGSLGVYPHDDRELSLEAIEEDLEVLYDNYKDQVVGVGECGIDITKWKGGREIPEQEELFKLQIGFALEKDLPLIIHNRNGDKQILEVLEHYRGSGLRGVVHCYSSDWETAKKFLDLGFYLSFTAIVTYPSAGDSLLEVVEKVPPDRYLIETDAPYLPPQGHRGETNYPKYVTITAGKIAEIRKTDLATIEKETFSNTLNLFTGIKQIAQ